MHKYQRFSVDSAAAVGSLVVRVLCWATDHGVHGSNPSGAPFDILQMQSTGLMLRKFTPIRSSRNLNLGKLSVSLDRICSMDISHSFWLKAWHNKHCSQSHRTIIVTQRDFLQFGEKFMLLVKKNRVLKMLLAFGLSVWTV